MQLRVLEVEKNKTFTDKEAVKIVMGRAGLYLTLC